MRKIVLLTLTVFLFTFVYSQRYVKSKSYKFESAKAKIENFKQGEVSATAPMPEYKSTKSGNIEKITLDKSGNIFGSLIPHSGPLSYNPVNGLIGFAFRADPETHLDALASGTIMSSYSTDFGASWSEPCYILNTEDGAGNFNNRFPDGHIVSPEGSSDMADAYFLVAGPSHDGAASTNWKWIYSASAKTDCSNSYSEFIDVEDTEFSNGAYFSGLGLMAGTDNIAHFLFLKGQQADPDFLPLTKIELIDMVGTWDVNHFVFVQGGVCNYTEILSLDEEGRLNWRGGLTGGDNCIGMKYSRDGQTGYAYLSGQSNKLTGGYEPQVFKTSDGGLNWDNIEIDFSDWQEELSFILPETHQGDIYPFIDQMDGAVDANGNLQLLVVSTAHSSSFISNPDSLGWAWTWPGELLNLEIDENGISKIIYVDSIMKDVVDDDNECAYATGANGQGWGHRIQVTMTPAEDTVFFTWVDDHSEASTENCNPDIFGNYRSVNDTVLIYDSAYSFTEGTDFEGANYFTFAGDYAYAKDGCWHIPYTQTIDPIEFIFNSYTDPVTHFYVDGISFGDCTTIGIDKTVVAKSILSVSQNIPNPFSTVSTIRVELDKTADLGIEVLNLLGQVVYTENRGKVNAGNHSFRIDANDYEGGLYFYTVKSGTTAVTKKMIIE